MKIAMIALLSIAIASVIFIKTEAAGNKEPPKKQEIKQQEEPKQDNRPVFEDNYQKAISYSDKNVLLIFGADWCKYCNVLKGELKDMNLDGYVICLIDVEKNKDTQSANGVSLLPTSLIVNNGKEKSRMTGYFKKTYQEWVEKNRGSK